MPVLSSSKRLSLADSNSFASSWCQAIKGQYQNHWQQWGNLSSVNISVSSALSEMSGLVL